MDMGFTKVYALKGGWREWVKANYPTEKSECFIQVYPWF
jgi:3-mercaptopyruvate sulfurtransferase SseA